MRMRWAGHITRMGEKKNTYWVLVSKPEGRRQHGQPWLSLEDNIKMDLKVIWFRMGIIWRAVTRTFLLSLKWEILWLVMEVFASVNGLCSLELISWYVSYKCHTVYSYVVCFLLVDSPASDLYMPTFRNTLSVPSSKAGVKWTGVWGKVNLYWRHTGPETTGTNRK